MKNKLISAIVLFVMLFSNAIASQENDLASVAHALIGGDLKTKRELYKSTFSVQLNDNHERDWIKRFIHLLCESRNSSYEHLTSTEGEIYVYNSAYRDASKDDVAFFTNLINGNDDIVGSYNYSDSGIPLCELYFYAYQIAYHFSGNRQTCSYYMNKCIENIPKAYDSTSAILDGFANYIIMKENPEVDIAINGPFVSDSSTFCNLKIAYELSEDDVQDLELLLKHYFEYYKRHSASFAALNEYQTNYLEIYLILQTYYYTNNQDLVAREHIPFFDRIMYRAHMDEWTKLYYNTLSYGLKGLFDQPLLRKRDTDIFYSNYYYVIIFSEFDKSMEKSISLIDQLLRSK